MAAQNLKPAKNTRPHHGGGQPGTINQFIKNRYQQTWHTIEFSNNRHTRHHPNQRSGSLRSNFSNLPDPAKLCKSAFPRISACRKAPTHPRHTAKCTVFQAVRKGVGRYLSASAAATGTTLHGPEPNRKSHPDGTLHNHTSARMPGFRPRSMATGCSQKYTAHTYRQRLPRP